MPDVLRGPKVTPSSPKLRDSCQACAQSKVKCPREKPSCSRCETRGISCQYLVVKRPGRRRMSVRSTSPVSSTTNSTINNLDSTKTSTDTSTSTSTNGNSDLDDALHFSSLQTEFSDAFSTLGDVDMSPGGLLPDFGAELIQTNMDYFMTSMDAYFDMHMTTPAPAVGDALHIPSTHRSSMGVSLPCSGSDGSPGGCLTRALDLLKSVSVDAGSLSQARLLVENKLSTEEASRMLACSCTEDGFVLTVLSMIVLKLLGRYAVAAEGGGAGACSLGVLGSSGRLSAANARDGAPSDHSGTGITAAFRADAEDPCDGDEHQRIAAQSVLGELHCVQRLVNELAPRLKTQQDRLRDSQPTPSPFSAGTMDQIGSDLRKSLSSLSLGIIHNLRQR